MEADIGFVPYNYLFMLDSAGEETARLDIENAIIIVDEAHNIRGFAEDQASFEIGTEQLEECLVELKCLEEEGKETGGEVDIVRALVNHWIRYLSGFGRNSDNVVKIKESNFPKDTKVFDEKEVLNLIQLPRFKGQTVDNCLA